MHHRVTDRWLRQELADLRESKNLTRAQAARAAYLDVRTIERIERGPDPVSRPSLTKLLHAYAPVRAGLRQQLWSMRELAYLPGWWDDWHDADLRPSYAEHCELEEAADGMDLYAPTIFHGLVQCPEYAAFVQRVSPEPEFREGWRAERLVQLRIERQQRFWARPAQRVRVLVDETFFETALRGCPVREQTDYVLDLEQRGLLEARFIPLTESLIVPDVFVLFTVRQKMALCLGAFYDYHVEDERTMTVMRNLFDQAWHRARPMASRKEQTDSHDG